MYYFLKYYIKYLLFYYSPSSAFYFTLPNTRGIEKSSQIRPKLRLLFLRQAAHEVAPWLAVANLDFRNLLSLCLDCLYKYGLCRTPASLLGVWILVCAVQRLPTRLALVKTSGTESLMYTLWAENTALYLHCWGQEIVRHFTKGTEHKEEIANMDSSGIFSPYNCIFTTLAISTTIC